jgi:hypothetical protein
MRTVKTASALAMALAVSSAIADSGTGQLKGTYVFSGSSVCAVSPALITPTSYTPPPGFRANLTGIGETFPVTFSIQGIQTFNGDGTGSIEARIASLSHGNQLSGAATDQQTLFTYSVDDEGNVMIQNGQSRSVFVAGPRTGQEISVSDVPIFVGHLSSDRKSIAYATFNPGVETVTRMVPGPELVESLRLCHRARTAMRIGHGDD